MLVLSRKRDESVVIRDDIIITIVEIRGDKVRLGIEAPDDIAVHRSEVWAKIQQELAIGTIVKYEGLSTPLIVAQLNPLVIVGVLGDCVYTTIHKNSLKILSHDGPNWTFKYPAAYQKWCNFASLQG